jgi:hypothetical protein
MRYAITRSVLGFSPEIVLTWEEYDRIRLAKRGIIFALGVEERFNIIRENFREYENDLFAIAQRTAMYCEFEWSELVPDLFALNRRLLNFLAAAYLYREHLGWELAKVFGPGSSAVAAVDDAWQREQEHCLAFRLGEALRNNIQHHSLPIYQVSRPMETRDSDKAQRKIRYRADAMLSVSKLAEDKDVRRSLLEELKPYATKGKGVVSLNAFIRDYLQALGRIHKDFRDATTERVSGWDVVLTEAVEKGKEAFGDTTGLVVGQYDDDEDEGRNCRQPDSEEDLFCDPIDRRKYLERRACHAHLMPNANDYVSTE